MKKLSKVHFLQLLAVTIGTAIYAFGFVEFNMGEPLG